MSALAATPKTKDTHSLRWLFKTARKARFWIGLSVAVGFCSGLLMVAQAGLLANIIQRVFIDQVPRQLLIPSFGGLAVVILLRAVLAWAREVSGFLAGAKIRQNLRMAVMTHLVESGPAYLSRQKTGGLSSIVLEQIESLHDFFAYYLPQLALAVMIPLTIIAFILPISWAAAGLLALSAPSIPLFMVLVGMGAESISQKNFQALARLSAHFLDVLQGLPTLKLFDRSRAEVGNIGRSSADYRRRTMQVLRVAFLSSAVLEFFSSMAIALVAVYLGMHYLGYLEFGDYGQPIDLSGGFFILLLAPDFYLPLRELGTRYHARAEAVGAAKEILRILSAKRSSVHPTPTYFPANDSVEVRFERIHYTHDRQREPVLQDASFQLNPGERVALVGSSGVGKTTLLHLLMKFIDPLEGQIRVNGVSLGDVALSDWHRRLAWIGQQPVLFHGTVRDNILMGNPDATDQAVLAAARTGHVVEFCRRLPNGIDSPVGEHGFGLSRGQAQRVALARAFIKDAPLLLLDEPTAGLDIRNEQIVLDGLEVLCRNRTVLMATHRLENLKRFDRVLVLVAGRIAESGAYSDLIAQKGALYAMVQQVGIGDGLD